MKQSIFALIILSSVLFLSQCKKDDNNNTPATYTVATNAADLVTSTSAKLNGTITGSNGATTVTFEWGLTTSYGNTVTADQSPVTANSATNVSTTIDSLAEGTTYHYRVVATNSSGKTYGSDIAFTTQYSLVLINTTYGNILIWLYNQTPQHKANFLKLTKNKYYDNLTFHRVIQNFMIQGGDPLGNGTGGPGYTIPAEFNDSLTHVYGAVAAARDNNPEKRSSGSQFYIVENKPGAHYLDKNYTVFGIVLDGMPAVEAIAVVPKDANNKPLTPVYMTKVEVVMYTAAQLKSQFKFNIPTFK